jgi:predicted metal-dependent peptidase
VPSAVQRIEENHTRFRLRWESKAPAGPPRPPRSGRPADPAAAAVANAWTRLASHPLFGVLAGRADLVRHDRNLCPDGGWAVVDPRGSLHVHPRRRGDPEEWTWVLAHGLLHLGFWHFETKPHPELWNLACDLVVGRFLEQLKIGRRPEEVASPAEAAAQLFEIARCEVPAQAWSGDAEERLYRLLVVHGPESHRLPVCGTAGPGKIDLVPWEPRHGWGRKEEASYWRERMGEALRSAVAGAVDAAGGRPPVLGAMRPLSTAAARARSWVLANYPLLGALAATFEVIEDAKLCQSMDVRVAAVDDRAREIYLNPLAGLSELEARFVLAHELLHVGLRHEARRQGRDHFLWNVACDYVINDWLLQMGVGRAPQLGMLHDPGLAGLNAETVYDRMVTGLRRHRKLATLRGQGLGDMLSRGPAEWWYSPEGVSLDQFYKAMLSQGLFSHEQQCRGLLPAGLVEEILALDQPALPWDVALAQWFDARFPPLEPRRTYARPSRRQSSTPEIPRPSPAPREEAPHRTYAVLLDTSGSMDRRLLGKALGAIASYSIAREVTRVRLVFCDAAVYDQGYVAPEEIAGRVRIRGRGGTVLQPGIDLLIDARDFPPDGPVLVITDGQCDALRIGREHAFLLPAGASLPFIPRGPVFRVR